MGAGQNASVDPERTPSHDPGGKGDARTGGEPQPPSRLTPGWSASGWVLTPEGGPAENVYVRVREAFGNGGEGGRVGAGAVRTGADGRFRAWATCQA